MDGDYLLTYETEFCMLGVPQRIIRSHEWFEEEEEMDDFIKENDIKPIEKIHIHRTKKLLEKKDND